MGYVFSKPAKRGPQARGVSTRQYLPRPERGGGQVLFVEALGRAWRSGSGTSLRFFWGPLMAREASLFDETNGSVVEAYLLLRQDGGNIPPAWIERAATSRKNREKALAQALKKNSLDALSILRDWELAYRKECFYYGIRALMELQRAGKTKL